MVNTSFLSSSSSFNKSTPTINSSNGRTSTGSSRCSSRMSNRSTPITISSCNTSINSNISNTSSFGCRSTLNEIPNSPRITLISYQVHKPVKRIDHPSLFPNSYNNTKTSSVKRFKRRISISIPFGTDFNCKNSNMNNFKQHPNFNSSNIKSILHNSSEEIQQHLNTYTLQKQHDKQQESVGSLLMWN